MANASPGQLLRQAVADSTIQIPGAFSALTARLIDLQRVLQRPWIDFRWRVKDLGQFWFSAPSGVTDDDRAAWFEIYGKGQRRSATRWAALMRAGFYQFKDGRAA